MTLLLLIALGPKGGLGFKSSIAPVSEKNPYNSIFMLYYSLKGGSVSREKCPLPLLYFFLGRSINALSFYVFPKVLIS